jgi:hypothetical protein
MRYEIKPLEGVNDYIFGMTRAQAEAVGGKPKRIVTYEPQPQIKEKREAIDCVFLNDQLIEMMFFEDKPGNFKGTLIFRDINLFKDDQVIAKLAQIEAPKYVYNDRYLLFENLCMLIGGFGNTPIVEGRNVILFHPARKDFWMRFLANNPYKRREDARQKALENAIRQAEAEHLRSQEK